MTMRESLASASRHFLLTALALSALFSASASAREHCPSDLWLSGGSCCEPDSEYVASKNQCMVVRPERRCAQGHLDDCVSAARGLEQQGSVGEGYAVELYRYACEEGHAPGCRGLAQLYNEGRGVERDAQKAVSLWDGACSQGDAPACTTLARLFVKQGAEDARVRTLLAMGCHRGDAAACSDYASNLSSSPGHQRTAAAYLERACSGGVGTACRQLDQADKAAARAEKKNKR